MTVSFFHALDPFDKSEIRTFEHAKLSLTIASNHSRGKRCLGQYEGEERTILVYSRLGAPKNRLALSTERGTVQLNLREDALLARPRVTEISFGNEWPGSCCATNGYTVA